MRTLKFPAADLILTGQELHGFATLRAHRRLRILWHDDHAGSAGEPPNSLSPLSRRDGDEGNFTTVPLICQSGTRRVPGRMPRRYGRNHAVSASLLLVDRERRRVPCLVAWTCNMDHARALRYRRLALKEPDQHKASLLRHIADEAEQGILVTSDWCKPPAQVVNQCDPSRYSAPNRPSERQSSDVTHPPWLRKAEQRRSDGSTTLVHARRSFDERFDHSTSVLSNSAGAGIAFQVALTVGKCLGKR
jgi:hypothetical protein